MKDALAKDFVQRHAAKALRKNPVANCLMNVTFAAVNILVRTTALALLALWLPVSMHCSLEALPGFNLLDWCCDTAAPKPTKDDCGRDHCSQIEAGLYRVEDNPSLTPNLTIILMMGFPTRSPHLPKPISTAFLASGSPPLDLVTAWQFSCRAALPVRAPSFVS